MALEINLTPEDVERLVKQSIMQSGFGAAVTKALQFAFSGYDNPIDKKLKEFVGEIVATLLRTEYGDQIKLAVVKAVQARVTNELIDDVTSKVIGDIIRKNY